MRSSSTAIFYQTATADTFGFDHGSIANRSKYETRVEAQRVADSRNKTARAVGRTESAVVFKVTITIETDSDE